MSPKERRDECLRRLDAKDYYNGGQTIRDRYPMGSEQRARIVAEAAFWNDLVREGESDGE